MADMLILEFTAPDAVHLYEQVNKLIGLDPGSGSGNWPEGMISHLAGGEGNHLVVVEEWESRGAQDEFMHARLQPAFADAQVPPPSRVAWLPTVGSGPRR